MGCCCTKLSATADETKNHPDKSQSESTGCPEAPQEPPEPQETQETPEKDIPFPIVQVRSSTNPMTTTSEDSEVDEDEEKWEAV